MQAVEFVGAPADTARDARRWIELLTGRLYHGADMDHRAAVRVQIHGFGAVLRVAGAALVNVIDRIAAGDAAHGPVEPTKVHVRDVDHWTVAPDPVGRVLIAHHKPTWQSGMEHVRERQALASARIIEDVRRDGEHVVLAGDFDATPDQPGHTFTPHNPLVRDVWRPRPGRRIDDVMVRCGDQGAPLDIAACGVVLDTPTDGVWARSTGIRTSSRRPREFGIPAAADAPASTGVTVDDAWPADRPDVGPDAPESRSSHRSVQSTHRTPVASTYAVVARPSVG